MFRRRDEDDYEFPIQPVNKNFPNSAIPAAGQNYSAGANPAQGYQQPAAQPQVQSRQAPVQQSLQPQAAPQQPAYAQQQPAYQPPAKPAEQPKAQSFAYEQPKQEPKTAEAPESAAVNNTTNKESTLKPVNQNQPVNKPATQPQASSTASHMFSQTPKASTQVSSQPASSAQQAQAATPTISFKPSAPAGAPSFSAAAPTSQFNVETERRLTVGYGIFLEGKVSNCDKLVIYGDVNAELNNVKALQISDSGQFRGAAEVEQAEISGTFEGSLRVRKNILINSSGRVNGKITYGSIEIKPGGKFTGEIVEDTEIQENADSGNSESQDLDIFSDSGVDKAA